MFKRDWSLYIEDILESIELIESYVKSLDLKDFEQDRKTIDAVVRNFEIIGEASRNIPDYIREDYPDLDWGGLIGLRNRVVHEYFGISLLIVWTIIKEDLPRLKKQMKQILKKN